VKPRKRRRRGRIVISLLIVLSVVGLAPVVSVAWKMVKLNREALTTTTRELQLLLAASIAAEVETSVEAMREHVGTISDGLGQDLAPGALPGSERMVRLLEGAAGRHVIHLRYTGADGEVRSTDPSVRFPPSLEESIRASVEGARVTGDRGWLSSPVVLSGPGRDALLVASTTVLDRRGRDVGVLSAVVHFGSIWDPIMERNKRGQTVFAMTRDGTPFASNDPSQVLPGTDLGQSELVDRFRSNRGLASETAPFRWIVDGAEVPYLGSYRSTDEGWGIFVQARESDIYQPVRAMVESTLSWAALALCLAILAAIVFARTLSNPIDRLAAATRGFADGDFRTRVDIRSRNEIGELAETFNGMADQLELHIEKLRRAARENAELFLGTIRALANAIDAKDPYTRGHSVRVNRYSVIIARAMGLPKHEVEKIHVASVMHDVGKIGIHDAILQKPGALTRDEFEVMKTHTTRGAEIMAPIPQMREVIPGLRSHHERWNGTGYPDGLVGEQIPLMGRIIAVADTFDAMTTRRPYQEPFTFEDAAARINELKGLAFDERVVEAFNRAYAAGEFGTEPAEVGDDALASPPSSQAIA
jgi:HD-GYP domain-containing protein (c-di-GMP phosphodiesterase class II)